MARKGWDAALATWLRPLLPLEAPLPPGTYSARTLPAYPPAWSPPEMACESR